MATPHARFILFVLTCLLSMSLGLLQAMLPEEKKHEDNSWLLLCEMHHTQQANASDKFVINAIVSETGCQLTCMVLESSFTEHNGTKYLDRTVTHLHNLNDGIYCKRDHVCKAGECLLELTDGSGSGKQREKTGIVVIDVLDAYVPQRDTLTFSDAYVKIVMKSPHAGDLNVGKTKVVWDTEVPVFNTTVKMEKVPISSTVLFEIKDKDLMGPDDYIASVYKPLKTILKKDLNHKPLILHFLTKYYLRVQISWIADE